MYNNTENILDPNLEVQREYSADTLELNIEPTNQTVIEDTSICSEESTHSPAVNQSPSTTDPKRKGVDDKPTMRLNLPPEHTDSQQSLSTTSHDYFDEETAV